MTTVATTTVGEVMTTPVIAMGAGTETDRHVATVLAEAVPGVVRATAFAARKDDDR
jgi:hypothetical protein